MDFPDRLHRILDYYGLSANELAEKLRIQKSAVSHLLSGRNKPRFDILHRFAEAFPDLNMRWFITGEGIMHSSPTPQVSASFHNPEDNLREKNDMDSPAGQTGGAAISENPRENALNEPKASPVAKNPAHQTSNATDNTGSPTEILRIYKDGTFDILYNRNK